ncbi:flavin reductase family protein [Salipiger sp.]|uniref:flavin reductase family protein n=1 Tax=Salipiger sp. TaxID=2078585 RepID=UPI003A96C75E
MNALPDTPLLSDDGISASPTLFDPALSDPRLLRSALGRFATGVTVVTCATADGPVGLTANSFASVSLDPPLVLWSVAKATARYPAFAAARHFGIHVLGREQEALSRSFARSADAGFAADGAHPGIAGIPLLDGALARFECELDAHHDGGDHTILIGRVLRAAFREGAPLAFAGGCYGDFLPAS